MSLSEDDKTHNQRLSLSSRSKFLNELAISVGVPLNATVYLLQCFSLISLGPLFLEVLFYYIVILHPILPSTCLLSNPVLKFFSHFPLLFDFLGVKVVVDTVQRSFPH